MAGPRTLDRRAVPSLLAHLAAALAVERRAIDDLNVFPVPDGDTGTNLVLTVRAGRDAVAHAGIADDVVAAARRALLRGARGNSGVIVSQVLAAFVAAVDDVPLDVAGLPTMLADARDRAYAAVAAPVQGTILTVLDAAVESAASLGDDVDLVKACLGVADAVDEAVAGTQETLEANRRAGVVDAGARGFAVLWRATADFLAGEERPTAPSGPDAEVHASGGPRDDVVLDGPAYEVMYVLELDDASRREDVVDDLRRRFGDIGDSVVVVGDEDLVQAHVHTDDIGAALDAGGEHGVPSDVRVTRFADQVGACAHDTSSPPEEGERPAVGFVAVVPGPGVAAMVADLGATTVHGTAGDLPNVAVLLEAVGRTRAHEVVVLPGHPNVVPTAVQAAEVSRAEGGRAMPVVLAADSVPAVLATLLAADVAGDDIDALEAAAAAVRAGEVVRAVRDAETEVGAVREGQWLGVVDGDVVGVSDEVEEALQAVLDAVVDDGELVTLVAGRALSDDDVDATVAAVRERLGDDVEIECYPGGQEPAVWIVGVE